MGRDSVFGRLMHLLRPDLDLKGLPGGPHQRRMKGLVHIHLGHGDVILEPARNRRIHLVDHAQRRIAVLHRIHDDPHGKQIIDLIQRLILEHHFFVNAEKMLDPPIDLRMNVGIFHMLGNLCHDLLHELFPLCLPFIEVADQLSVHLRLGILQRQVVQLDLDLGDPKPLCNGRIDVHGLPCLFLLLPWDHKFQSTHIVQTVRQLDDDHPDVLGHGQKHLPQVLRLDLQLILGIAELSQLGHPVHQESDLFPKFPGDILQRHVRILHHVMEHPCRDGFLIHLQVGKNDPHPHGMDQVRLSGLAHLVLMRFLRQMVRLLDQADIGGRMVLPNPVHQRLI